MATLDELKNLIKAAEKAEKKGVLTKVDKQVYYGNADDSVKFNSLEEAFRAKANLADFEEKVIETSFKKDFYSVVTKQELEVYKQLIEINDKLQGLTPVAELTGATKIPVKAGTIAQRLNKLYKEFDSALTEAKNDVLLAVYEKIEENISLKGDSARESAKLKEIREKIKEIKK